MDRVDEIKQRTKPAGLLDYDITPDDCEIAYQDRLYLLSEIERLRGLLAAQGEIVNNKRYMNIGTLRLVAPYREPDKKERKKRNG